MKNITIEYNGNKLILSEEMVNSKRFDIREAIIKLIKK